MKMTENRSYLQKYAMHFGTYMGAYWILKFILLPLMFAIPFFQLLYVILTLAVPIIGYYYVKIYRDKVCGGAIQFSHAVLFTIFMYMFASLLVAVAHYIYFQFIDHGFIFNALADFWNQAIEQSPALQENKELMKDMFDADKINSLSAIDITMQIDVYKRQNRPLSFSMGHFHGQSSRQFSHRPVLCPFRAISPSVRGPFVSDNGFMRRFHNVLYFLQ